MQRIGHLLLGLQLVLAAGCAQRRPNELTLREDFRKAVYEAIGAARAAK